MPTSCSSFRTTGAMSLECPCHFRNFNIQHPTWLYTLAFISHVSFCIIMLHKSKATSRNKRVRETQQTQSTSYFIYYFMQQLNIGSSHQYCFSSVQRQIHFARFWSTIKCVEIARSIQMLAFDAFKVWMNGLQIGIVNTEQAAICFIELTKKLLFS